MTYKPRRERRASGGKAETEPLREEKGNQYNAVGSPEEKSEHAKSDGFKRGGHAHRKHGGHVEGKSAMHHLGKRARGGRAEEKEEKREERARGGHVGGHDGSHHHAVERKMLGGHAHHHAKRARGGATPFSSAHNTKDWTDGKESGPGEKAPVIP